MIEPGPKYLEHLENKTIVRKKFEKENEDKLKDLRDKLKTAEENNRFMDKQSAIQGYHDLAAMFFEDY